ncbi:MAG: hypothetical protein ACJ741_03115 [Pyrinomonadaceae bacterium]
MSFDWQTAVVILIVLAAALYVGRMTLSRLRSMRAGGGSVSLPACSGCDNEKVKPAAPAPKVLVQIGRQHTTHRR